MNIYGCHLAKADEMNTDDVESDQATVVRQKKIIKIKGLRERTDVKMKIRSA